MPDLGEKSADVTIYLFGLTTILNINLTDEIVRKVNKNEKLKYKEISEISIRTKDA